MTTIAELIADELRRVPRDLGPLTWEELQELANEITKLLVAHGFGHVPTALNEAADALLERSEKLAKTMFRLQNEEGAFEDVVRYMAYSSEARCASSTIRARAAETGGTE